MANTQINITENGTTTLATAGKYCDRNVNVNVNVKAKPTQFTNYYIPENVKIDIYSSTTGTSVYVETTDTECNALFIHHHHKANEPFIIRMRGIGTVRGRFVFGTFSEIGTSSVVACGQLPTYFTLSYDDYGDAV